MTDELERASHQARSDHEVARGLYPAGPARGRREQDRVHVELPDEPPSLSPLAAKALLRILRKAYAQRKAREEQEPPPQTEGDK